jgi:predicted transcriptional regulator
MPTSVHLPKPLLDAIDRRAKALRISRNRLIVRALERELDAGGEWSTGFFERLEERDDAASAAVDELLVAVVRSRRSKGAPKL